MNWGSCCEKGNTLEVVINIEILHLILTALILNVLNEKCKSWIGKHFSNFIKTLLSKLDFVWFCLDFPAGFESENLDVFFKLVCIAFYSSLPLPQKKYCYHILLFTS